MCVTYDTDYIETRLVTLCTFLCKPQRKNIYFKQFQRKPLSFYIYSRHPFSFLFTCLLYLLVTRHITK